MKYYYDKLLWNIPGSQQTLQHPSEKNLYAQTVFLIMFDQMLFARLRSPQQA